MNEDPRATGGGLQAVLFDMDGTLLDSEKVWDVSLGMLAAHLGGRLSPAARADMVGSNMDRSIAILHADLGVHADPAASAAFLTQATEDLFATELRWRPGATELLDAVAGAGLPCALVTSTIRRLTDVALSWMGAGRFETSVCGDEVARPKPAPDPYRQAAADLDAIPSRCVVVEDSPLGIASGRAAGCPVLGVPSEVPLPEGPGVTVRASLLGVTLDELAAMITADQIARGASG